MSLRKFADHRRHLHAGPLGADPLDGGLYLLCGCSRRQLKALWFGRTGWAIFSKRLARGTSEIPEAPPGASQVAVDVAQLPRIVGGIERPPRRWLI
jgi:hypothetical protein